MVEREMPRFIPPEEVWELVQERDETGAASLGLLRLSLAAVMGTVSRARNEQERQEAEIVAAKIQAKIDEASDSSPNS